MANLLPAICDLSVTNVCNAACDFCGFARDKTLTGLARYVDADAYLRALPILFRRGIRYMTLQGGEPLVHPDIIRLVSQTARAGISGSSPMAGSYRAISIVWRQPGSTG